MTEIKIDVGADAIGKALEKLVDVAASGIGAVWAPHQMKRIARAEVEVARIKAAGEQELRAIERRLPPPSSDAEIVDAEILSLSSDER